MKRLTILLQIFISVLLVNCSALVNPDPDSLDRRDGGDVDGQEDAKEDTVVDVLDEDIDAGEEELDMPEDSQEDEAVEDILVEDSLEEPDSHMPRGTVLLSDSGGGKASNAQYKLYGSISNISSKTCSNENYNLRTHVVRIQTP